MNRRLDKMRKLVRFREFRESMAADSMRQRLAEAKEASRTLDSAQEAVEEAESWKARSLSGGSVDIGLYGFALENEQETMARRDAARSDLEDCRQRTENAASQWREAATASRVVRERALAESRLAMEIGEKRMFDQLGDLLISRKADSND